MRMWSFLLKDFSQFGGKLQIVSVSVSNLKESLLYLFFAFKSLNSPVS